jgi:dTDP-4-amino-4,6-dideoxygalactose transaminase
LRIPLVDLRPQVEAISAEVAGSWDRVLTNCDFILGGDVAAFEEELAAYCGVAHAVGVDSGTSALELALRAVGVGPGDEVVTPANTFIASALAITHCGATPVLVDVDPETLNLDPWSVEAALTPRTRALLPVHLYGHTADMDTIDAIASAHGLAVVEDACQAHGARYKGRRAGALSRAAAFSFYPGKNLGGFGDGGAVVTDDPDVADAIRAMRNYGQRRKHHHECLGFNRRLDTLQAAVLRIKLSRLDEWNAVRRRHAAAYAEALAGAGVVLPADRDEVEHVWHLFVIQHPARDELAARLDAEGISTGIHYPVPIHLQPAYAGLGLSKGAFPVAEAAADAILSLPMYPELPPSAVERIAEVVGRVGPVAV